MCCLLFNLHPTSRTYLQVPATQVLSGMQTPQFEKLEHWQLG